MTAADRRKGFASFLEYAALLMALIVFCGITAAGFFVTCGIEIDFAGENIERVFFVSDNIAVNVIVLVVALCVTVLIMRLEVSRKAVLIAAAVMALNVIVCGLLFVEHAHALPYADSDTLIQLANTVVAGNWDEIRSSYYLRTFPYQMGYLLFLEGFIRAFGTESVLLVQKLNVFLLALSELALVRMASLLFANRKVTFLTALFCLLFIQPIFLTTFVYGNIPGMFFALLAILFTLRALRGQPFFYFGAAAAMAVAVLLKMNYAIVLIAVSIVLALTALKNKKSIPLMAAAGMIALTLIVGSIPQKSYESRAGVSFGEGTPQGAWLVTGFRESSLCCGWYNSYTTTVLMTNGYDQEATRAQIKTDFEERLAVFRSRPQYAASFFGKKLISQWQEPSYQGVWSSAAGPHSAPVPAFVESVYTGRTGEVLNAYFNHLMQFVYVSFLIGLVALVKNRSLPALILPLTLLGAVLYHLLFEAKAQYVMTYIPLMLPVAAFGLASFSAWLTGKKRAAKK